MHRCKLSRCCEAVKRGSHDRYTRHIQCGLQQTPVWPGSGPCKHHGILGRPVRVDLLVRLLQSSFVLCTYIVALPAAAAAPPPPVPPPLLLLPIVASAATTSPSTIPSFRHLLVPWFFILSLPLFLQLGLTGPSRLRRYDWKQAT